MMYEPLNRNFQAYAHRVFRAAIAHKEIAPTLICAWCQSETNHIQGHHEDYIRPFAVIWLCRSCHAYRHSRAYKPRNLPANIPKTILDVPDGDIEPLKKTVKGVVARTEKREITKALKLNRWNRRKTAKALQISYRSLLYKIISYEIAE